MRIGAPIFPKNTSENTVHRYVDGLKNSKRQGNTEVAITEPAVTNYKTEWTRFVAAVCKFFGVNYFAQDDDKIALETALNNAYRTIQSSGGKTTISNEFMLGDKNDIMRFYRLELASLKHRPANQDSTSRWYQMDSEFLTPDMDMAYPTYEKILLEPVAFRLYQYDKSTKNTPSDQLDTNKYELIYQEDVDQSELPLTLNKTEAATGIGNVGGHSIGNLPDNKSTINHSAVKGGTSVTTTGTNNYHVDSYTGNTPLTRNESTNQDVELVKSLLREHRLADKKDRKDLLTEIETTLNKFTTLELQSKEIGPDSAEALANALKNNNSIKTLRLHCHRATPLSSSQVKPLIDMLKENKTITELALNLYELQKEDREVLTDAISKNTTLKTLRFEGAVAITPELIKAIKGSRTDLIIIVR